MTIRPTALALLLAAAAPAVPMPTHAAAPSQSPPAASPRPSDRGDLRHQIYVMEGALARAVAFGAQRLNQEIRSVMPDLVMLAGDANARGFYLEGHGVFFDVEVPVLRQSMLWSLRMLMEQDQQGAQSALTELRRHVEALPAGQRGALDTAIRRLERRVSVMTPAAEPSPAPGAQPIAASVPAAPVRDDARTSRLLDDPGGAYTELVQRALIDAMIDFSAPMVLGADEWLTVAARDNERRDMLAPQAPFEEVVTVMLRIRGSDLAAYRAGRIDRDEARRRVAVSQF